MNAQATLNAGTALAAAANTQIALANAQNTSVAAQLSATPAAATQAWQETQQSLSVAQTEQAIARLNADATATASIAQTQDALHMAQAIGNMTVTASVRATADYIAQEAQARRDELAEMQLQRERTTQLVKTWAGWVIFAILFGLLLLAGWRLIPVLEMRLRLIQRGEHISLPQHPSVQLYARPYPDGKGKSHSLSPCREGVGVRSLPFNHPLYLRLGLRQQTARVLVGLYP